MEPNQPQSSYAHTINNRGGKSGLTIAIIVVALLLIAVIVWKVFGGKDEILPAVNNQATTTPSGNVEGTTTAAVAKTYTVTLTDEGFSPTSLTIDEGGIVKFVNDSTGKMWVASDPHPKHDAYPGFDEKTAADHGESFEFTFTKVGRWGFHNHLNPAQKGAITVFTTGSKD
jgi:plastocyanin